MLRSLRLMVASIVFLCLTGVPAYALTVSAPADATGPVDVAVALSATEPTGTVFLYDGTAMIGEQVTSMGSAIFGGLALSAGPHLLHATLQVRGSTVAISPDTTLYRWSTPGAPTWISPTARAVTSPCEVRLTAGASTVSMTLRVAGNRVRTIACRPGEQVTFTGVRLLSHVAALSVEVQSLTGETAISEMRSIRFEFPYATCIIIDKSEYRLYWVKNQQLIKKYPVAHGRYNHTPIGVWKVLAKYKTAPRGVYGPRKLRMFRRVGRTGHYRYVFTAYGIHGTNQPWVIGTQASHGCIRMYNRDVLELWPQVPIGTVVITRK